MPPLPSGDRGLKQVTKMHEVWRMQRSILSAGAIVAADPDAFGHRMQRSALEGLGIGWVHDLDHGDLGTQKEHLWPGCPDSARNPGNPRPCEMSPEQAELPAKGMGAAHLKYGEAGGLS